MIQGANVFAGWFQGVLLFEVTPPSAQVKKDQLRDDRDYESRK